MRCAALIVAAGRGARFGEQQPKQYARLGGVSILRHALLAFYGHPSIQCIQTVIHPDDHDLFAEAMQGLSIPPSVTGGATRQESVLLGLEALEALEPDTVLIHDGARPNISTATIENVLAGLNHGAFGSIPVLPVAETLKRISAPGTIQETVSRDNIVRAQTPQAFVFPAILKAHRSCMGQSLTDDAAVMEKAGYAVETVLGDPNNIKITEAKDLYQMSEILLETRTGNGFDVHRLGPGDGIILGGLPIPMDRSLIGHSDADVVLHAATDAILGAIADNDIGFHFPPSDDSHKGAASLTFLQFAISRLETRGGSLTHLDLTVICERPKISAHRDEIRRSIASIAGVSMDRVNVKATTTEGLGFTGRGEGIACQAIATVKVTCDPA